MESILKDDNINADKKLVWQALITWIENNMGKGADYVKLLKNIRFAELDTIFFKNQVMKNPVLIEAISQHSQPEINDYLKEISKSYKDIEALPKQLNSVIRLKY